MPERVVDSDTEGVSHQWLLPSCPVGRRRCLPLAWVGRVKASRTWLQPRADVLLRVRHSACAWVPKSAQTLVATLVRSIFAKPDQPAVWAQHPRMVE